MEFSDMLASSIHDIKNSLAMVINTLDELIDDPDTQIADQRRASLLQHEAHRANDNLIQLLSLYKMERKQLAGNIAEHALEDFLEEIVAENRALAESMELNIDYQCEDFLTGYFDDDLVRGVLNSAIGNAERYASENLLVSASFEDEQLVIRVEDDGNGFPPMMIEMAATPMENQAFSKGRTQLGLYFAQKVAAMHRNGDRVGHIQLRNGINLSGGCFELWLP